MNQRRNFSVAVALLALAATPLAALVQPDDSPIQDRAYRHGQLHVGDRYERASAVSAESSPAVRNLDSLSVSPESSRLDLRSGRWATLMPVTPMLPGRNDLTWDSLKVDAPNASGLKTVAWDAFVSYLRDHQDALLIDVDELTHPGNVVVHEGGRLIQINAPRTVGGVPVRNSFLTGVIRHGNLILFGSRNWGDVEVSSAPTLTEEEARSAVLSHLNPFLATGWNKSSLTFVPLSTADEAIGEGVEYRLAWALQPRLNGELGNWEALVDAHSGELLAFEDQNHYASTRVVEGGIYPVSNNGLGAEGTEQADFPMAFADVANAGTDYVTDSGGNLLACVDGSISSALNGPFVTMVDNCGAISESTGGGILDFGTSGGDNCTIPAGAASAGDTHASRSGFYELNRIIEMARGQLPDNTWLQQQLISNMNINNTCNAFWNGQVNFYRSGGGCGNTGELAGVFDHEWGHGLDDNDVNPSISSPGEGIADIYAYLRLDTSCIGPGFRLGSACNGYGDPCVVNLPDNPVACDGVRDINWDNRASGLPHDVDWADANCGSGGGTPCGGSTHCEGAVYAEALYDLVNRDLDGAGFDHNTALEIATRLTYLGAGSVGSWFSCTTPFGGCGGDGGYLNFLAADDDGDGLANGTPHMAEIFAAFDRHQIACDAPAVANSGCAGTPVSAPLVTATALDRGVLLDWGPTLAGGTVYKVYRTDGVRGCDFGKVLVGETTGTTYFDDGLKNGHEYYYTVIGFGPDDACFGPASDCITVTPTAGANLALGQNPVFSILPGGDGDSFLDNCEQARAVVQLINVGSGASTNTRITAVTSPSHPELDVISLLPINAGVINGCGSRNAAITFQADGVMAGEVIELEIVYTNDELSPQTKTATISAPFALEGDLTTSPSLTFSFEADLDGWQVIQGTFDRSGTNGGGDGTSFAMESSGFLGDQCDRVRSPIMSLSASSTMTLWNNWDIEVFSADTWYDRANVGIVDANGDRSLITPDGGRLYNADSSGPGNFTGCNEPEEGWAGLMDTWGTSSWSAGALQSATFAGELIQLEAIYSTDALEHRRGFSFDQVTVTDVSVAGADGQSDVCVTVGGIFTDGFESGDASAWASEN